MSELLKAADETTLDPRIAVVPAGAASRVVYFATLLHSQRLKVAALLDSDQEGESAAAQDDFVRLLTSKRIHRTKDHYTGSVGKPETEDLIRGTLVRLVSEEFGVDVSNKAKTQATRPISDILSEEVPNFSKYRVARAFLRWTATHELSDLAQDEIDAWKSLFDAVNRSLK